MTSKDRGLLAPNRINSSRNVDREVISKTGPPVELLPLVDCTAGAKFLGATVAAISARRAVPV